MITLSKIAFWSLVFYFIGFLAWIDMSKADWSLIPWLTLIAVVVCFLLGIAGMKELRQE